MSLEAPFSFEMLSVFGDGGDGDVGSTRELKRGPHPPHTLKTVSEKGKHL